MAAVKKRIHVDCPSVLVLHEKHGERYFIVNNDAELFNAALVILKGRLEADCFYFEPKI